MNQNKISKFQLLFVEVKRKTKIISILIILLALPLVYYLVYRTGGVKNVYSHTMYLVILLSSIMLGAKYGILTGVIAGIILGPLMPLDTKTGEEQIFFNWLFRLIMFMLFGFISGYGAEALRKNAKRLLSLLSHNQDTDIPNINILTITKNKTYDPRKHIVITVLVNNYDNIVNVLGLEIYYKILRLIYQNLQAGLNSDAIIIQTNNNKLLITKPFNDYYVDIHEVLSLLNKPLEIEDIPLYVEFNLGVVITRNQKQAISIEARKQADDSARFAQKNNLQYLIYDEKNKFKQYDISLLGLFKEALAQNQTYLVFQPKIDLKTSKPIGLEALVRWEHPTKGLITPDVFIPLVEETQLINQLTDWVLKGVVKKIKEFKAEGIDINISMNISAKNLYDPTFFNRVSNYVKLENISPKQIEFEIVESILMSNPEDAKKTLKNFGDLGFTISLDDFGKGYSSLAYLSQFPINIVKLDEYFMRQIAKNHAVQLTVQSTIDLAHNLGYKVVSEGIEEEIVASIAKEYNSDYAQGYYFSKPIKGDEIINWYKKFIE